MLPASDSQPRRSRERYVLGSELWLDVGQQRLERGGAEIAVPKLSFDFLLALVRAAPDVVAYDDLMTQVWPGLVVQLDTISQRAKLLRDALGDDPQSPKFVRGVRGRGYVLACAVQTFGLDDAVVERPDSPPPAPLDSSSASPSPEASHRRFWRRPGAIAVGALLAIIATATTVALLREGAIGKPSPSMAVAVAAFQAPTADPRDVELAHGIGDAVHARVMARRDLSPGSLDSAMPIDAGLLSALGWHRDPHYRLKGSLQRSGERLRVTVQVLGASNDELIHSFIAEADARDVLRLEDDIAQRAARAMRVEWEAHVAAARPDPGTRNAEARLAFERGRARYQRWRVDDGETAIVYFKRSIALDPGYARAYLWEAMAELRNATMYRREDWSTAMQRVQPLFDRAIALGPQLGEAYAVRDFNDFVAKGFAASEAGIRKGLALEPSSAESWSLLAQRLEFSRPLADVRKERLEAIDRAIAVSPETTRYRYLKMIFLWSDPATATQAVDLAQSVLDSDPDFAPAVARLAHWRWFRYAQPAEAVRWSEHAIRLDPETSWLRDELCLTYLDLADPLAAHEVSDAVEAEAVSCRAALALYEGDWRRAAQLVFQLPPAVVASCDYMVGVMGALSRYARETGDTERVLAVLRQAYGEQYDAVSSEAPGMPDRAFLLLQLYRMRGDRVAEQSLMDTLGRWLLEVDRKQPGRGPDLIRAKLMAWSGRDGEALDELLRWTRKGHSPFWWYVFEHDVTWERLRRDPRFIEALRHERNYVAGQRAILETLRRQGVVPVRAANGQISGTSQVVSR